jgi:hypothetical protein
MFSWITGLFGSSDKTGDVLSKAADGLYNGIDKLVYTDEEKAEALSAARQLFLTFADKAYDQNSIRSVTRRWLAFIVVGPCITFYIASAVAYFFDQGAAAHLMQMATGLTPWAGGVLVFYFGPHLIGAGK